MLVQAPSDLWGVRGPLACCRLIRLEAAATHCVECGVQETTMPCTPDSRSTPAGLFSGRGTLPVRQAGTELAAWSP